MRNAATFSRDACFIVDRPLLPDRTALAVMGRTSDPDALLSRPSRHLFLVPWRSYTLVGVWHEVHRGAPEDFRVTEENLAGFVDEINGAQPDLGLGLDDVALVNAGLTLFGVNEPGAVNLSYGKRSRVIDHRHEHGVPGLITVIGVRATVARGVAEQAVDMACDQLDRRSLESLTEELPLAGGDIGSFTEFRSWTMSQRPLGIEESVWEALLRNYGSAYDHVLKTAADRPELLEPLPGSTTLAAEVIHAVRHELAITLSDVVFRRTDLATGRHPGADVLRTCAALMARELGWESGRVQRELDQVDARLGWGRTFAAEDRRAQVAV